MNSEDQKNEQQKQIEKYDFPDGSISNYGKKKNIIISSITLAIIVIAAAVFALNAGRETNAENHVKDAVGWDVLKIDGNRNGKFVDFDHEMHKDLFERNEAGCRNCHHLSKPNDGPSSCNECHSKMDKRASIFDHDYHNKLYADNNSCRQCHKDGNKEPVSRCSACHKDYTEANKFYRSVRGYKDAMHTQCAGCHQAEDEKMGETMLNDCAVCHQN